jgi:hypothetical protein
MEVIVLIKMYCKHICKCHYVSPLYNYYMLIKKIVCVYVYVKSYLGGVL